MRATKATTVTVALTLTEARALVWALFNQGDVRGLADVDRFRVELERATSQR